MPSSRASTRTARRPLAELRAGTIIVKVDNQRVASAQAARQLLEAASLTRGVLLQVQSPQGGLNFVLLKSEGN